MNLINRIVDRYLRQIETSVPITLSNFRPRTVLCFFCIRTFCGPLFLSKHLIIAFFGLLLIGLPSYAEDVKLRHSFAGNFSYEVTGGSMRSAYTSTAQCQNSQKSSSSGKMKIPEGSNIEAAYLYWSGSGDLDNNISFNGAPVSADLSNSHTLMIDIDLSRWTNNQPYYSARADVTALITAGESEHIVSGLSFARRVERNINYCTSLLAYGGWALVVIYEKSDEPLRVINVFDGYQQFWGSELTLRPNNFIIAKDPKLINSGKHAHITWEGDAENSDASSNGRTETLLFAGNVLKEADNPDRNQFNSYSSGIESGKDTSGVDIDVYDISQYLTEGQTAVETKYSTGQDMVFLTAEVLSVPNKLVSDLELTHTVNQNPIRGQDLSFTLNTRNFGPSDANNEDTISSEIRIDIDKVAGLNYTSFEGQNWSCSNTPTAEATFHCTYLPQVIKNASASSLIINYTTDKTLANDFIFSATAEGTEFDHRTNNNRTSQTFTNTQSPDLTTSEKLVFDLNGGLVNEGDVLRYQINIKESAGYDVNNITVTDYLPVAISSAKVVSAPDGTTVTTAATGSNTIITVSGISVVSNQTEIILIDATLKLSGLSTSDPIINTADITSAAIDDISISSQSIYVSTPANASSGYKPLYIHNPFDSNTIIGAGPGTLSRQAPSTGRYVNISRIGHSNGDTMTWKLGPTLQAEFKFSGDSANAFLCLRSFQDFTSTRTLKLDLLAGTTVIGSTTQSRTLPASNRQTDLFNFEIPLTNTSPIPANTAISLRIQNRSTDGGIKVFSLDDSSNSAPIAPGKCYIELPAKTVINVDSIALTDTTDTVKSEFSLTDTLKINATVSDPFGSADITDVQLTLYNPNGQVHGNINKQSMNLVSDSGIAIKIVNNSSDISFQESDLLGQWRVLVTAKEGYENDIEHSASAFFILSDHMPNIKIEKKVNVLSDLITGDYVKNTNHPKAIPGSILEYVITATNTGLGKAEADSVFVTDLIPENTIFSVESINNKGPIQFRETNKPSGLTYTFINLASTTDDVEFSNNNGTDFNYIPSDSNNDGLDENITHFRVNPKGIFQAPAAGEDASQFKIKFRVQLQ
ncbi:MAG: DUF3344 domain-containing protein [Oleispira sp.]